MFLVFFFSIPYGNENKYMSHAHVQEKSVEVVKTPDIYFDKFMAES